MSPCPREDAQLKLPNASSVAATITAVRLPNLPAVVPLRLARLNVSHLRVPHLPVPRLRPPQLRIPDLHLRDIQVPNLELLLPEGPKREVAILAAAGLCGWMLPPTLALILTGAQELVPLLGALSRHLVAPIGALFRRPRSRTAGGGRRPPAVATGGPADGAPPSLTRIAVWAVRSPSARPSHWG